MSLKEISKVFFEGGYKKFFNKLKKNKKNLFWFEMPEAREKDFYLTHWSYFEPWTL